MMTSIAVNSGAVNSCRAVAIVVAAALAAGPAQAQNDSTYVATAYVAGNVLTGTNGRVQLTFERWSSDETRAVLLRTLVEKGGKALAEALRDTESVGYIRVGTQTSHPLAYAREFNDGTYRRIIAVTDRPIQGFEAPRSARTLDYDLTLIELRFDETGAGEGVLIVGAEVVVDMQHRTLSVENLGVAPVRLLNVRKN